MTVDPDIDGVGASPGGRAPFPARRQARWPRLPLAVLGVVFTGGVAGGMARYAVTSAWPTPATGFPWATFVVNTVGAFALSLLLVVLAEVWAPHPHARALIGTGFLGAFTTFSAVTVAVDELAVHGHGGIAAVYLVGSVVAGLGVGSVGLLLGRAVATRRPRGGPTQPVGRRR